MNDLKQEKKAYREMHKHQDLIEQKKQYIEHGKILYYNPVIQQNIALLGFHRNYMSAYTKNKTLEIKKDKVGISEIWISEPITKDLNTDSRCKVALKPKSNPNLYLCCEKNGSLTLKPHCKTWETWIVEKEESTGMFSFKSYHNTYLCADSSGKPKGDRKHKKDWEKWRIVVVQQKENQQQQQQQAMVTNDGSYYGKQSSAMVVNDGSYY